MDPPGGLKNGPYNNIWGEQSLRGVISMIRAKWGMVIIADTADPNSALNNQMTR